MKRTVLALLCILTLPFAGRGGEPGNASSIYQPGEELRYSVKWKFFRLGTIVMKAEHDTTDPDPADIKLTMIVESNPDLSFLFIKELNESRVIQTEGFARDFYACHQDGDDIKEAWQHYEAANHTAIYTLKDKVKHIVLRNDTLVGVSPFVEGSALFFKARALSGFPGTVSVPTMIMGRIQNTTLCYGGDMERISIDACSSEIRTRKFTGRADWTGGTAGMSGDFCGWLSDDEAAIPIRAEMKILIGSIDLELEGWTHPGWTPPTGMLVARAADGLASGER